MSEELSEPELANTQPVPAEADDEVQPETRDLSGGIGSIAPVASPDQYWK